MKREPTDEEVNYNMMVGITAFVLCVILILLGASL